jgi:hypothetical protein
MTQLSVTQFESGAVRDTKQIPVRWDLFSIVALNAIATAVEIPEFDRKRPWLNYVGDAANHLLTFIGGKRDRPYLELAWWSLAHGCDLREMGEAEVRERTELRMDFRIEPGNLAILPYRALKHLASTCAEGCEKYGEWNWLYGFPLASVISHALDHIWSLTEGDTSEDHWGHAIWNIATAIHNYKMRPDLCTGLLGDWFVMTDEIKAALEAQREERRQHELGRERVPNGQGVLLINRPENVGLPSAAEVAAGVRPAGDHGDEWEGVAPAADGSTALGRAIESARGGAAPTARRGFA